MKIIDNIFIWIGKKLQLSNPNTYDFQVIKDVLVVHIPVGCVPVAKAEDILHYHMDKLAPLKEEFGVKYIYTVAKRDS